MHPSPICCAICMCKVAKPFFPFTFLLTLNQISTFPATCLIDVNTKRYFSYHSGCIQWSQMANQSPNKNLKLLSVNSVYDPSVEPPCWPWMVSATSASFHFGRQELRITAMCISSTRPKRRTLSPFHYFLRRNKIIMYSCHSPQSLFLKPPNIPIIQWEICKLDRLFGVSSKSVGKAWMSVACHHQPKILGDKISFQRYFYFSMEPWETTTKKSR